MLGLVRYVHRLIKSRHIPKAPPAVYVPMGRVEEIHISYNRAAEIRLGSIGMYEANCPRVGTIAYFKQGEPST